MCSVISNRCFATAGIHCLLNYNNAAVSESFNSCSRRTCLGTMVLCDIGVPFRNHLTFTYNALQLITLNVVSVHYVPSVSVHLETVYTHTWCTVYTVPSVSVHLELVYTHTGCTVYTVPSVSVHLESVYTHTWCTVYTVPSVSVHLESVYTHT